MNAKIPADVKSLLAQKNWQKERRALRFLLLKGGLTESVKWGKLCYTYGENNVAIIYGMKDSCAIGFFKGTLLDDAKNILVSPGEHSQAMRRLHFNDLESIEDQTKTITSYIRNAIDIEKKGLEVVFKAKDELKFPEELREQFDEDAKFESAFVGLTPGRQRGWVLHFSGAKQSATRTRRIEKAKPNILKGKGPNDR